MYERELEDWICENPYVLGQNTRIIGRQIALTHGRLDILAICRPHPTQQIKVIELKARELKERDVGQVLRYIADVRGELIAGMGHASNHRCWKTISETYTTGDSVRPGDAAACASNRVTSNVRGVLIGASIDDATLAACAGASLNVSLWRGDRNNLHLESIPVWGQSLYQGRARWVQSIVGDSLAFGELARNPFSRIYHTVFNHDSN